MKYTNIQTAALSLYIALFPHAGSVFAEESPWHPGIKVTAGTNSNLGQAELDRDIINDNFVTLNLGIDYKKVLKPGQLLTLRPFLETVQWNEVRDMSRVSAGGKIVFDWQPAPGPTALIFQANALVRVDDYRSHKQRDSTIFSTQLMVIKRFSDRVRTSLGVEYRDRDSSGTVWDLNSVRGFLSGAFAFRPSWSVHGTYSHLYGDVWSNAQTTFSNGVVADDIFGLVSAADAIEPDEAFNSAFCGPCSWHAYRLTAHTNTYEVGIDKEFGQGIQADLSYLYVDVDARGDNKYDVQIIRVSLLKRF